MRGPGPPSTSPELRQRGTSALTLRHPALLVLGGDTIPAPLTVDLVKEKQVSLTQIPQAWARAMGAGSMTQIFQVCEAQTSGGKWSPTCGAVTAQEEEMACLCCRDGNRCFLQQGEFWSHVGKDFQMLWVELGVSYGLVGRKAENSLADPR